MVFSIAIGDGTSIFARNAESGSLHMSDPVCLVNEDQIVAVGEPSKLGAIGFVLSQKAKFKLEYSLKNDNGTDALRFNRRFWKRMNVEETNLMVHAKRTSRKIEPHLLETLRRKPSSCHLVVMFMCFCCCCCCFVCPYFVCIYQYVFTPISVN